MQRPAVGLAARWPWDAGFLPVPSGRQVRPKACACIRAGGEQGGGPGGDRSWGHRLGGLCHCRQHPSPQGAVEGSLLLSDQQGGVGRAVGPRLEPGTSYRPVSGPLSHWAEGGRESRAVLPQERVGSYVRTSAFSPFGCLLPPLPFCRPAFIVRSCKNDHILCTWL